MNFAVMDFNSILKDLSPRYIPTRDQWRMMCPFRENHTGLADGSNSFFITPGKNAYHCFSCGASGNLVKLLTVNFKVPLFTAYSLVTVDTVIAGILNDGKKRETPAMDEEYIPMTPAKQFIDRGFPEDVLEKLEITGDDKHVYIPVFDNDVDHKIVGYKRRAGRNFTYMPAGLPKERYLYNYRLAKRTNPDLVVLVEGETDVIKSCASDIWNVVCQSGGELSEDQTALVRTFKKVYLAMDNDQAGIRYTEIAAARLLHTVDLYVLHYDAEDPGSCGRRAWVTAYNNPVPYAQYVVEMTDAIGDDYVKMRKMIHKKKRAY